MFQERSTKQCPYCRKDISANAKKCKHCGCWLAENGQGSVTKLIKCPVCDENVPADSAVCPECGESLSSGKILMGKSKSGTSQGKNNHWWVLILILLLIGGIAYYILNSLKEGDEPFSRSYLSSVRGENIHRDMPKQRSMISILTSSIAYYILNNLKEGDEPFSRGHLSSVRGENIHRDLPKQRSMVPTDVIVEKWDIAHNIKDYDMLNEIYADTVFYYQSSYTLSKVIESKRGMLAKTPRFHQESVNVCLYSNEDGSYRLEFDKKVWTDYSVDEYKSYPSYLIVTYVDSSWKITTESDKITDANLAKRVKKNKAK